MNVLAIAFEAVVMNGWKTTTARKIHYCWGCGRNAIEKGDQYDSYKSFEDGIPETVRRCIPCRAKAINDEMRRWERFKKNRNLPFLQLEMVVDINGKRGRVIGTNGDVLRVRFESGRTDICHPEWQSIFYDAEGNVIQDWTPEGMKKYMSLPEGKNCGDCNRFSWCETMRDQSADSTQCQWQPIKFVERNVSSISHT